MAHDHAHHGGQRAPAAGQHDLAFAVGIALNSVFVAVEFGYGVAADSTALIADAVHNLGDVAGLALAWFAAWLARRAGKPLSSAR